MNSTQQTIITLIRFTMFVFLLNNYVSAAKRDAHFDFKQWQEELKQIDHRASEAWSAAYVTAVSTNQDPMKIAKLKDKFLVTLCNNSGRLSPKLVSKALYNAIHKNLRPIVRLLVTFPITQYILLQNQNFAPELKAAIEDADTENICILVHDESKEPQEIPQVAVSFCTDEKAPRDKKDKKEYKQSFADLKKKFLFNHSNDLPDPYSRHCKMKYTFIDAACEGDLTTIKFFLFNYQARAGLDYMNKLDRLVYGALHSAARSNQYFCVKFLASYIFTTSSFESLVSNVTHFYEAIESAGREGHLAIVELLISYVRSFLTKQDVVTFLERSICHYSIINFLISNKHTQRLLDNEYINKFVEEIEVWNRDDGIFDYEAFCIFELFLTHEYTRNLLDNDDLWLWLNNLRKYQGESGAKAADAVKEIITHELNRRQASQSLSSSAPFA